MFRINSENRNNAIYNAIKLRGTEIGDLSGIGDNNILRWDTSSRSWRYSEFLGQTGPTGPAANFIGSNGYVYIQSGNVIAVGPSKVEYSNPNGYANLSFNSLIDEINDVGGGSIQVYDGTYEMAYYIDFNEKNNIRIDFNKSVIVFGSVIDNNGTIQTQPPDSRIRIINSHNIILTGGLFTFDVSYTDTWYDLSGVNIGYGAAVMTDNANFISVNGIKVKNCQNGIVFQNTSMSTISKNIIEGNDSAMSISVTGASGEISESLIIENNILKNIYRDCISIMSLGTENVMKYVIVQGNVIDSNNTSTNGAGIIVSADSDSVDMVKICLLITKNTISGNVYEGIRLDYHISESIVGENSVNDCATWISDDVSTLDFVAGTTYKYGIFLNDDTNDIIVKGNVISNCMFGLFNSGTYNIFENNMVSEIVDPSTKYSGEWYVPIPSSYGVVQSYVYGDLNNNSLKYYDVDSNYTYTDSLVIKNNAISVNAPTTNIFEVYNKSSGSEVLDQFQDYSTGSAEYTTLWQSFTVLNTGVLSRIGLKMHTSGIAVSGNLRIYEGEGVGGTLLSTDVITSLSIPSPQVMTYFNIYDGGSTYTVPVTAGQLYTFEFTLGGNINVPSGAGRYPRGASNLGSTINYDFEQYDIPNDNGLDSVLAVDNNNKIKLGVDGTFISLMDVKTITLLTSGTTYTSQTSVVETLNNGDTSSLITGDCLKATFLTIPDTGLIIDTFTVLTDNVLTYKVSNITSGNITQSANINIKVVVIR